MFSSICASFFLSRMLGAQSRGMCLICSGLMRRVRGSFRLRVKQGPLGSLSCCGVSVLSREVTGGKRSTDLHVILAIQQVILILLSSSTKFCSSVKLQRSQQSGSICLTRMLKKSMLYWTSLGSRVSIESTIILAVDPFSIISSSISYFRFSYLLSSDSQVSLRRCCISRPPGRCVQLLQCYLHLGHSSEQSSRIYAYLSTLGGSLLESLRLRAWSLPALLQLTQKHCSMECQSTMGPYVASKSMRSLMDECSRLGGLRNWCMDLRVILQGSSMYLGGSCGTLNWKILRSLLASTRLSLPWNSFLITDLPYLPLRLSGLAFLAYSGFMVPMSFFHLAMGSPSLCSALTSTMTQHSPLIMYRSISSKQGLPSCLQQRLTTSSRSNSRWNIFLMVSYLLLSMRAMSCYRRSGSRTLSGLMRAMVKGRLTCFASKSASYIGKLYNIFEGPIISHLEGYRQCNNQGDVCRQEGQTSLHVCLVQSSSRQVQIGGKIKNNSYKYSPSQIAFNYRSNPSLVPGQQTDLTHPTCPAPSIF